MPGPVGGKEVLIEGASGEIKGLEMGHKAFCHIHAPQSQLGVWIHSPQALLRTQLVPTPPLTLPWPMEVIVVLSGELCLPRVPPSLPPPCMGLSLGRQG